MSLGKGDLGVLGNLAEALGIFTGGSPNADWFAHPDTYMKGVLANPQQRAALLAFVDEALGGADNSTEAGVIWVPLVKVPDVPLTVAMTVDESRSDGLHIGVGLKVTTDAPVASSSSISIPLFRARKEGSTTGPLLLLGSAAGRIRIATQVTVSGGAAVPGQARLGAISLTMDLPTGAGVAATFGLGLTGMQMPGATSPRDVFVDAGSADELDDALLDLVLSLVKAQADAAGAPAAIIAVGGLLGLKSGDNVPDFPITRLPVHGVRALADWVLGIVQSDAARNDWLGHIGSLLGGTRVGPEVRFDLGDAALTLALVVEAGPSGHTLLTPRLGLELGHADRRVQARADLMRVDLVTGQATALPSLGVWAAAGRAGNRVIDLPAAPPVPPVRADTLRVGFAIDASQRLTFVLAADNVQIGANSYPVLDLTSPDAMMDALGTTVADIAGDLLGALGAALPVVQRLLGLAPPAGITAVTLPALMSDPLGAVVGYWQQLIGVPAAATAVLQALRDALADAGASAAVLGSGTSAAPWRLPLVGPLALEVVAEGPALSVSLAAGTSVDSLGQRCTVVSTRIAVALARLDLAARSAQLLTGAQASISARERGANPPRARLELAEGIELLADHVGLALRWSPATGLATDVSLPNPRLVADGRPLPIALPAIDASGAVVLPAAGWDALQLLVGHLAQLRGGGPSFVAELAAALGWDSPPDVAGGRLASRATLRLADLVASPAAAAAAIEAWLPRLLVTDVGPRALSLLADLFGGSGSRRATFRGVGSPDDPFRVVLDADLPELIVWFPPAGLAPALLAAPAALRDWRPGALGLPFDGLEDALWAEAQVADDVADLLVGRTNPNRADGIGTIAAGWQSLLQRWAGGDGRIAAPDIAPAGITVQRLGVAAGQLWSGLDIEDVVGRVPTTTVHVALGAAATAWPTAPAGRLIDLATPGLQAAMFALPAAATGEWFVALGTRAECLVAGSSGDGTAEQAARLARWLAALTAVGTDLCVVAVAGAGHAARVAAEAQPAVTDLVLLGTPLSPVSLTALDTQPAADALRLLHRLMPPPLTAEEAEEEPEDAHLALGRALVESLMALAPLPDPGADLRPPVLAPPAPRAGLAVAALFGSVSADQVAQAITAVAAAGLAGRARARVDALSVPGGVAAALPLPSGVRAGLRWRLPARSGGSLDIDGMAELSLRAADFSPALSTRSERVLRVRLSIGDRAGWLVASPALSLRAVSADLTLPLDGSEPGTCRITLHDAIALGQSAERLRLGRLPAIATVQPVLPEARLLLAAFVQRLQADVTGPSSVALADVLEALGLIAAQGGVVATAMDQLVHDPAGLVRQRLAGSTGELEAALAALLGPLAIDLDFANRSIALQGGSATSGRFGWAADVQAAPGGVSGTLRLGPDAALPMVGGVQLLLNLQPFTATLVWRHSGGGQDSAALWPAPDAAALARMLAHAAPGLGAQVALELMRRADESARPLIDAALDALGLLNGVGGDARRSLRPLAGLLRDPLGWLGSAGSLAAQPARIQSLLDAIRPLMGVSGAAGAPLPLASGVSLGVAAEGGGARITVAVDPSGWSAPPGGGARLSGGIGASLLLRPALPPVPALALHLGLDGAAAGRQAVHALIGPAGLQLFLRPLAGADIGLVPFAGLGSLAAAAKAALPFLLDRLAGTAAPVGPLVATLGDALALRSGTASARAFDGAALHAWGEHPAEHLRDAAPSIVATGLATLAPLLDSFLPATVSATSGAGAIRIGVGAFSLAYRPATQEVQLGASDLAVPGIDKLTFLLAINDAGLRELSFTLGPAAIDVGGATIEPFITIAAGTAPAGGRRVLAGLAASPSERFAVRWLLDPMQFALVASNGALATSTELTDPGAVALRIVDVVIDLAAAVAMAQPKVQQLLAQDLQPGFTVRRLLAGVLLKPAPNDNALVDNLFDPAQIPTRIRTLIGNLATATITVDLGDVSMSFREVESSLGLQISLDQRFALIDGDVTLWLENDDSWITPNPTGSGGLFVGFMPKNGTTFAPKLVVNGLGLRLGKTSGPLLDAGLTIESVALHAYAAIGASGVTGGGVQLQFANLAVSTGSAGGSNGIAQGVMRDTGPTPPEPKFSPALAVQKHAGSDVAVTLRAGDPPGPWWIAIQQGFGPLYLEQVGFDARMLPNGKLERVSVLMDGSVSMFGLTCAVDDLQVTYFVADGDFLDANNWKIDLAGLAVAADIGGVSIAGGLLKQESTNALGQKQTEYLGMLLGRFAVYGLTIYGGYGEGVDDQGRKFTAFFAIGAVNGPIGGPPAFFLTGIGGGLGINRKLIIPTDLSTFGDYPLIQALDIAASPSDPMQQLRELAGYFPMSKGTFWFAAGLSFNSFALVDGIAVVGVQIGDGLDINLLGLARMALPRPQMALVSIEVALVVRFSSSEGVLWVQGQLTDNSWLLYPDIRLTGGFAYVIWFGGERRGEFVLTLGGYHPDFSRPGYPQVPRLGLRWSIGSNIVIKAGSYFALTSEALMAGGDFEGSASFGPAWAEVRFGAHGIVYFDPFSYQVNAYCRIAAGVTIDTWIFGEVTFSISIGARIDVRGPEFRGSVTFEVGPIELTFDFGGSEKASYVPLGAAAFIDKYLESTQSGGARAHAVMTASGAQPSKGEDATPDGSAARPFVVVVEFGLTFTSTVPATSIKRTLSSTSTHTPSRAIAVGPMGAGTVAPQIVVTWLQGGIARPFPFIVTPRPFGRFPVGVWGPMGDSNNRKVPKADMVEALNELDLRCTAAPSGGGPEIPYDQVEIGKRLPLPFSRSAADLNRLRVSAQAVAALVGGPATVDAAFVSASRFLRQTASPTALAALRGERQAPPRAGTLAEGLESPTQTTVPAATARPPAKRYDHFIDAPIAVALLSGATADLSVATRARTTVKDSARAWRVSPPTLASALAARSRSVAARLVIADAPAVATERSQRGPATVLGAGELPLTAAAHAPTAIVARAGAPLVAPLQQFGAALAASPRSRAALGAGATLAAGQCVVLELPNARADADEAAERPRLAVSGAPARVVMLDVAGQCIGDDGVGPGLMSESVVVPRGTACIAAIGLGLTAAVDASGASRTAVGRAGLAGWHAGLKMAYLGHGSAVGPGCVVRSTSAEIILHPERVQAGWVTGAELARGVTTVSTRFSTAPSTVIVILDDPAVTGRDLGARQLLLGIDGARRATDAAGVDTPPVLLTMDNRSVLAYAVQPQRAADGTARPVVVSVASEEGWSLVAVMGGSLDPDAALGVIASRGLQAALAPMTTRPATAKAAAALSRLQWNGPVRSPAERRLARVEASGLAAAPAPHALRAAPAPARRRRASATRKER